MSLAAERVFDCRPRTVLWLMVFICLLEINFDLRAADPVEFPIGDTKVFSLQYSPDGNRLAVGTGGSVSGVKVFDVSSKKILHDIPCESRGAGFSVAFNRDGTLLAIGDFNLAVTIRQMKDGSEVASLPGDPERKKYRQARRVAFLPGDRSIVVGYSTGEVFVWDIEAKKVTTRFDHKNSINALDISSDGKLIATGTDFGLRVCSSADGTAKLTLDEKSTGLHEVQAVAFSPDGKAIQTVGNPGIVRVFNIETAKEDRRFVMPSVAGQITISTLALTNEGKTIVVPGLQPGLDPKHPRLLSEGLVLLDAATAKPKSFLMTGSTKVISIAPGGKTVAVATGNSGDSVSVYDFGSAVTLTP